MKIGSNLAAHIFAMLLGQDLHYTDVLFHIHLTQLWSNAVLNSLVPRLLPCRKAALLHGEEPGYKASFEVTYIYDQKMGT